MAFVINEDCVSCGTCAANCPAEAIEMGDDRYVIDQDKCVSCGTCKENCPADAIIEK
ncbi:MAG: 4Fe-4S binding protein [Oscillospiraceae bacterium]